MSTPDRPLTDAELIALAAVVHSTALGCYCADADRLANGLSVAYGDAPCDYPFAQILRAELVRRGVLA